MNPTPNMPPIKKAVSQKSTRPGMVKLIIKKYKIKITNM